MIYEIEISSWGKYNPKRDQKTYTWFRFDNDFFEDERIYDLSDAEQSIYIKLLCYASKKNSGQFELSTEWMAWKFRRTPDFIDKTLKLLVLRSVIGLGVVGTTPTNERTNERILSETSSDSPSEKKYKPSKAELLECYALYPRKEKKTVYLKRACKVFKKPEDIAEFKIAIAKYTKYVVDNNKEDFVKLITTFLSEWRDWLEDGAGDTKLSVVPVKTKWNEFKK